MDVTAYAGVDLEALGEADALLCAREDAMRASRVGHPTAPLAPRLP